MANLFTVTQIADRLDEKNHRVNYTIAKLKLKPVSRVGIIRLFDLSQEQIIKQSLHNLRIQHD